VDPPLRVIKDHGDFPVECERLTILVILLTRTEAQSCRRKVVIWYNSHCSMGGEFRRSYKFYFSDKRD